MRRKVLVFLAQGSGLAATGLAGIAAHAAQALPRVVMHKTEG